MGAAIEARLATIGPPDPKTAPDADEWINRLGSLPLMAQPGERWLYNTGPQVLAAHVNTAQGLTVWDPPDGGWARPPAFEDGAAGLVSTVDDLLAFARMFLHGGAPLLSRESVREMTRDQLTPAQRAGQDALDSAIVSPEEVDEYLRGIEQPKRGTVEALRRTILEIVPGAEQVISYRVPAFRVRGEIVAAFRLAMNLTGTRRRRVRCTSLSTVRCRSGW